MSLHGLDEKDRILGGIAEVGSSARRRIISQSNICAMTGLQGFWKNSFAGVRVYISMVLGRSSLQSYRARSLFEYQSLLVGWKETRGDVTQ